MQEIHTQSDESDLCPNCGEGEDGTHMICCDGCDRWHHWRCVIITSEPKEPTYKYFFVKGALITM